MFVVKNKPPFGREHFGGGVGVVDWGQKGENVIVIPDESNSARSVLSRPDLYRVVYLPNAPEVAEEAPEVVEDPSYNDLRATAKELGISSYGKSKDELIELIAEGT